MRQNVKNLRLLKARSSRRGELIDFTLTPCSASSDRVCFPLDGVFATHNAPVGRRLMAKSLLLSGREASIGT
jgi:hypothetical protein